MALRLEILFFFFFDFLVFWFFVFLFFFFFVFLVWVAIAHVPSIFARNYEWLQRSVCGRNMCKKQCNNCTARVSPSGKILVKWDDYSQYMGKSKMFQNTNQKYMSGKYHCFFLVGGKEIPAKITSGIYHTIGTHP